MINNDSTFEYMNIIRALVPTRDYVTVALLLTDTIKEVEFSDWINMPADELYRIMLSVADHEGYKNPFDNPEHFYRVFQPFARINGEPDWESLIYESTRGFRYNCASEPLYKEYMNRFGDETRTVLIAEAEKFLPNLKKTVDARPDCLFTLASEQGLCVKLLRRVFNGYENVEVLSESIYKYEFTNRRFDLIWAIPNFGVRSLAEEQIFMTRDQDSVALENLLLHTSSTGKLVITMPGRITFAQGRTGELRRFVQQTYRLNEISELPGGTFEATGIKTYLIEIEGARPGDNDITIRRYKADKVKGSREITGLSIEDETFVVLDEIDEMGDWNINKVFSQQDEEWLSFQGSSVRRSPLGEVAEVFRGKSISNKDPNGAIGVVNISNIGEYEINYDELDHLDEEERKVTNYVLKAGDVVLPARGTAIRTSIFREQAFTCIASSNVIIVRPNERELNSTYLKLFLDSPLGNKLISGIQQGQGIINISYKDLMALEIPVPPIEEQIEKATEYENELKRYIDTVTEAETRWKAVLMKLREF